MFVDFVTCTQVTVKARGPLVIVITIFSDPNHYSHRDHAEIFFYLHFVETVLFCNK